MLGASDMCRACLSTACQTHGHKDLGVFFFYYYHLLFSPSRQLPPRCVQCNPTQPKAPRRKRKKKTGRKSLNCPSPSPSPGSVRFTNSQPCCERLGNKHHAATVGSQGPKYESGTLCITIGLVGILLPTPTATPDTRSCGDIHVVKHNSLEAGGKSAVRSGFVRRKSKHLRY